MTCIGIPYIWWNPPIPSQIAYAIQYDTITLTVYDALFSIRVTCRENDGCRIDTLCNFLIFKKH